MYMSHFVDSGILVVNLQEMRNKAPNPVSGNFSASPEAHEELDYETRP